VRDRDRNSESRERGGREWVVSGVKKKKREIDYVRRTIKILHSIPYIHNIYVFRLYPLHRSNINNILLFHSYRFKYIFILVSRINKRGRRGGGAGTKDGDGAGLVTCLTYILEAVLVVLSCPKIYTFTSIF